MANLRSGKNVLTIGLGAKRMIVAFLIALITPTQSVPEVGTGCPPACAARSAFTSLCPSLRHRLPLRLPLHPVAKITIAAHPTARAMNFGFRRRIAVFLEAVSLTHQNLLRESNALLTIGHGARNTIVAFLMARISPLTQSATKTGIGHLPPFAARSAIINNYGGLHQD